MSQKHSPNRDTSPSRTYLRYTGLAFQILAAIFLGIWAGLKLDEWLGLKYPIFTIVLSMVALLGTLVYLIKSLPKS